MRLKDIRLKNRLRLARVFTSHAKWYY